VIRLVVRPVARRDLAQIWSYTAEAWGIAQADSYVGDIDACLRKLLEFPEIGSRVEGLPEQYRKVPSGSHRIIYRMEDNKLMVVRVIHEREDVPEGLDDI